MTEETLLEFPCQFPIKAMGKANDEFELAVLEIFKRHVPDLAENAIKQRPSARGNYLSITVTINATSKAQLDAIYMDLTACEHVAMSF
ncbi:MAG: DUF493 domain-containing protein [Thioalkalispiraceae bacterium]|jgi:putative lipoic acid-binding regulatory protein